MKSLSSIFLFCLLMVAVCGDRSSKESTDCAGAVYTISNAAPTNQVFIFGIDRSGRLTGKKTINTHGAGVNTSVPDALNSQGSMKVYSNYLFVVNPGSHSLSMFAINPKDPTELKLISVQPTNGQFPISITVNSKYVCVLTGAYPAGIRCFTYNRFGLFVKPSFDRTIPLEVTQIDSLISALGTLSQILFSADNRALIVDVKGVNLTTIGYLLFYQLTNNYDTLSLTPTKQRPNGVLAPFGMSLVEKNGLLITEAGSQGVLTMTYSSASGTIQNSVFTPTNASIVSLLCWAVYSRTVGNYYVVGAGPPTSGIIELNLNLASTSNPVNIVRYYPIPITTSALDPTIVTVAGVDYLYVIGAVAQIINVYRLDGPGNAVFLEQVVVQEDAPNKPWLGGIAAYVSARSPSHQDHHQDHSDDQN